jgi:hypothetical protein
VTDFFIRAATMDDGEDIIMLNAASVAVTNPLDTDRFWPIWLVFKRRWRIRRTGRYHWLKTQGGWKIVKVEVLDEQVQ